MVQVQGAAKPPAPSGQPRATNILDSMASSRRLGPLAGSAGKPNRGPVLKPLAPRTKTKVRSPRRMERVLTDVV